MESARQPRSPCRPWVLAGGVILLATAVALGAAFGTGLISASGGGDADADAANRGATHKPTTTRTVAATTPATTAAITSVTATTTTTDPATTISPANPTTTIDITTAKTSKLESTTSTAGTTTAITTQAATSAATGSISSLVGHHVAITASFPLSNPTCDFSKGNVAIGLYNTDRCWPKSKFSFSCTATNLEFKVSFWLPALSAGKRRRQESRQECVWQRGDALVRVVVSHVVTRVHPRAGLQHANMHG